MEELEMQTEEQQTEQTEKKRSEPGRRRRRHKKRRVGGTQLLTMLAMVIIMLAFCVVMISPLKSCTMSDSDYIGSAAAQKVAFSDAELSADKVKNVRTDMIQLDEQMCYKVDFSGSKADFSYIISADSGKIVVSRSQEHSAD